MKKWFGKSEEGEESFDDFQSALDKNLKEEKTMVIQKKKQQSKSKAMVRLLLDNGYDIEEINMFIRAGKTFKLNEGEIIE